jgi:pentatricopeptide repeat protein
MVKKSDIVNFYGSDYDTSPEGMSFTVFFFTYSAVIGREWEAYQRKRENEEIEQTQLGLEMNGTAEEEPRVPSESVTDEVVMADSNILADFALGVCDGNVCPRGMTAVDNAVEYVTSHSPCPNFNSQAQAAYETLSNLSVSLDPAQVFRNASLLDDDEALAEYEEAREVAAAQLDLAFDALKIMENRGLLSDPDVFKSLMEACGRCGDTKRALELIEIMKRDKLVTDNDVLVCFMASFAHYGVCNENSALQIERDCLGNNRRTSDAYSHFLKKKLIAMKGSDSMGSSIPVSLLSEEDDEDASASEVVSDTGSEGSSYSATGNEFLSPSSFLQYFSLQPQQPQTKKKKKRRRKRRKAPVISDRVQKQLILGESLLDFLYPEVRIETCGDTCPMCSNAMKEEDIVSGWKPCEFQDFTTCCPQCQHRFVPRFKVSTSSPTFEGSQGPGTPLYCEFLSPWVLRKELGLIMGDENNIEHILDPTWRDRRDIRATIWWNLIVMFKRYGLPFSFLLQGSFQNRLINPVPQD